MSSNRLHKPDIGEHSFGSAFDPVLCGVAQGLARLFPPVEGALPDRGTRNGANEASREALTRGDRQVACRTGITAETGIRGIEDA